MLKLDRAQPATAPARQVAGRAVDSDLKSPLYHQIFVILRAKIYSGELAPGAFLPSEHEVSQQFGVSRITAKRALNDLAEAGLAIRERGRGTRVAAMPPPPEIRASVEGWLENMSVMGRTTRAEVLEFGYRPANGEVAKALDIAEGTEVQRAVRVRWHGEKTVSYLTTHIPGQVGRLFSERDLARDPLLNILERNGVEVSRARQIITATIADATVAGALGVPVGAPLLEVRRVVHDQNDRPVEYIRALYRPDQYHYEVVLTRVHENGANSWTQTTAYQSKANETTL